MVDDIIYKYANLEEKFVTNVEDLTNNSEKVLDFVKKIHDEDNCLHRLLIFDSVYVAFSQGGNLNYHFSNVPESLVIAYSSAGGFAMGSHDAPSFRLRQLAKTHDDEHSIGVITLSESNDRFKRPRMQLYVPDYKTGVSSELSFLSSAPIYAIEGIEKKKSIELGRSVHQWPN